MENQEPRASVEDLRAELRALLAQERAAISDDPVGRVLLRLFDASGLSRVKARRIAVLAAELITTKRLEGKNFPGPDELYRPFIVQEVTEAIGELMDALFAGKNVLDLRDVN